MKIMISLLAAIIISVFAAGCSSPVSEDSGTTGLSELQKPVPSGVLTDDERAGLIFMREEEKLARDVYITMYGKWGYAIFNNIAKSEQTHMDAILKQLNKYAVPDPVTSNEVGVFTDVALQALYTTLVEKGSASGAEALAVGVDIETKDIADIQTQIDSVVTKSDIFRVYSHLLKASEQHLQAFTSGQTFPVGIGAQRQHGK